MKKLDKKQVPQFAALCVVSAGLFGYLVLRMVTPGSAAAGTRPAPLPAAPPKSIGIASVPTADQAAKTVGAATVGPQANASQPAGTLAAAAPAADGSDAPPPTPGMRDPFIPAYVDPETVVPAQPAAPPVPKLPKMGTQMASIKELPAPITFPGAPALPPNLSSFPLRSGGRAAGLPVGPAAPPLPAVPVAPPAWTVTGVLQGATEKIAVLRDGENRRIVRSGEFVDSVYRVVGVSRTTVVLRHGAALYRLPLGGAKEASGKPSASAVAAPAASPALPGSPAASPAVPAADSAPLVPNADALPAALKALDELSGQMAPTASPSTSSLSTNSTAINGDASHG